MRTIEDVKSAPLPGDEIAGPKIKAKVLTVTIDASGISQVEYTLSGREFEYKPEYSCKVPLSQWKRFTLNSMECLHIIQNYKYVLDQLQSGPLGREVEALGLSIETVSAEVKLAAEAALKSALIRPSYGELEVI